jgi:hypothetical protein
MIGFERAGLFVLLLLVPPILWWLHRRRRVPHHDVVSSLLLWRRVFDDPTLATPRRPRVLPLVLEGLAAAALITAAAGPCLKTPGAAGVSVTVLIDRRPGMGATSAGAGETRLAVAVDRLEAWLAGLPPGTRLRVLTVPPTSGSGSVFARGDSMLSAFLRAIEPARHTDDFQAAVAGLSAFSGLRMVVTDENAPPREEGSSGLFWLSVGEAGENAGIVWARVRPPEEAGPGRRLSVGVLNGGSRPVSCRLDLATADRSAPLARIRLDPGRLWDRDDLEIPDWAATRPFSVRLSSDRGPDRLGADDVVAFRPEPGREIALVSAESVPTEVLAALGALGTEVVQVSEANAIGNRPTLFWKTLPPADTAPPFLLVATEGRFGGLRFGSGYRPIDLVSGEGWTEVSGVQPYPRRVVHALEVDIEGSANWVVEQYATNARGARIPLVLRREPGHVTVLAFDPVQDAPAWPKAESFPALFYRAFGQSGESHSVHGLLSAADTELGKTRSDPAPPPEALPKAGQDERRALHAWVLVLALTALAVIWLLEV